MSLVDYSDSDNSEAEDTPAVRAAPVTTKSGFQKVVDRSNPGKIRVSLPQASRQDKSNGSEEPPTKRAKVSGGTFGGFNSFLPPPKRTGQISSGGILGSVSVAKKGGLAPGVSLKTGSAPGFNRKPEAERYLEEQEQNDTKYESEVPSLALPKTVQAEAVLEETKPIGKPTMFRPLSVSRKPAKKKKALSSTQDTFSPSTPVAAQSIHKPPRAKVSLFSMENEPEDIITKSPGGDYQPMMFEPESAVDEASDNFSYSAEPLYEDYTPTSLHTAPPPAVPTPPVSQSLDDIAGDLRLSAAERRQLFGRQKGSNGRQAAMKVINFNTDQEYLHNEGLRAAGQQVTHNPVRAIAPGKHSLKQLVNAAQSQKEALEESFAKGKNNRAEASSRYGW